MKLVKTNENKKLVLAQRERYFLELASEEPVKPGTVFYHAFRTCIMSCSPFALFKELIDDPAFAHLEHTWVYGADSTQEYDTFKRYADHPRVHFVEVSTGEHVRALATCQYLITNAGLPSYWQKRPGQIVVNTWHGTPLKALGKDAKDFDGFSIGNAQRNFLECDYLVMPNRFTADRLLDSYGLEGLFRGKVIDEGAPRTDLVLNSDAARTRGLLEERLGRSLEGRKVVLYAPTFRSRRGKSIDTVEEMGAHMSALVAGAPEGYEVFFKVHNTLGELFKGNNDMEGRMLFDEVQTEELLGATDVLVTDYSSIFFDFICTGRPILFLVYDKEEYESEHGMYLDTADMPGTECRTDEELSRCLARIAGGTYSNPNRESALKYFAYNDDGGATRRVLDIIFPKDNEAQRLTDSDAPAASRSPEGPASSEFGSNFGENDGMRDVLISLIDRPALSNVFVLRDVLRELDPTRDRVTITACGVHLIWRMVREEFPSARILFMRISDPLHGDENGRTDEFYQGQLEKYLHGVYPDVYYNLKGREGFLDEVLAHTIPNLERHWRFCWSAATEEERVAELVDGYEEVTVYHASLDELSSCLDAPHVHCVSQDDLRARPDHRMTVLMIAAFDSMNHAMAAFAQALVEAGHDVVVASSKPNDPVNSCMFANRGIEVIPIRSVNAASLLFVDIAVGSPIELAAHRRVYASIARYGILLVSLASLFSSVAMRISPDFVLTMGESKAEEFSDYSLHYNCVAIGNPQYDGLARARADRKSGPIRTVLVLEQGGYPYGEKGKRQLADTLIRAALDNPEIRFDIKPRYLPDDKGAIHSVSEHLYDFIDDPPSNLVLIQEHTDLDTIVVDYDALMTMWSTAYLDALVLGMPMLLVEGFDSVDVFDVRTQRVQEAYEHLRQSGCVHHYTELKGDISDLFQVADADYANREMYRCGEPAAPRIVRFLEVAYETLVVPGLRIASEVTTTEEGYYREFASYELVDANSRAWRCQLQLRKAVNSRMQEYVYLNRCMGAVLDLSPLECYYYLEAPDLPDEEARSWRALVGEAMSNDFVAARTAFFDSPEGRESIEHDRVLQDFYFDWLYVAERYEELENPKVSNLLAPEGLELNRARFKLKHNRIPSAYRHLFKFLHMAEANADGVNQLLRIKRMKRTLRPFRGKRLPFFLAYLFREENVGIVPFLYSNISKSAVLSLNEAHTLNRQGRYLECVELCDAARRSFSARGRKRKTVSGTVRLYGKKALYRALWREREKALAKLDEQV